MRTIGYRIMRAINIEAIEIDPTRPNANPKDNSQEIHTQAEAVIHELVRLWSKEHPKDHQKLSQLAQQLIRHPERADTAIDLCPYIATELLRLESRQAIEHLIHLFAYQLTAKKNQANYANREHDDQIPF
jgi:hypothetical protein